MSSFHKSFTRQCKAYKPNIPYGTFGGDFNMAVWWLWLSHQIQCKLTLLMIISILHMLIINPYPTPHQDSELKDTTYIPKLTLSQVIFKWHRTILSNNYHHMTKHTNFIILNWKSSLFPHIFWFFVTIINTAAVSHFTDHQCIVGVNLYTFSIILLHIINYRCDEHILITLSQPKACKNEIYCLDTQGLNHSLHDIVHVTFSNSIIYIHLKQCLPLLSYY